jgi:hypothetical protein
MKKNAFSLCVVTFISSLSFISCGEATTDQEATTNNQDQQDSAQLNTTASIQRAKEGDSVWIYINHVKADKRQDFEKLLHEVFFDSSSRLSDDQRRVFQQTRILHPTQAEKDGSYSYVFLMDPVISGGEYDIEKLMEKIYGKENAKQYMTRWASAEAREQTGYILVQSRH